MNPVSKTFKIVEDPSPFRLVYSPGSALADADGNVRYPNVDVKTEMLELAATAIELQRIKGK